MNELLYQRLAEVARSGGVTHYGEVASLVGLDLANAEDRRELSDLLREISRHEHEHRRPLLSAVVIHVEGNIPGNGFFTLARDLGLFEGADRGEDRLQYFTDELRRVHEQWRGRAEAAPFRAKPSHR